MTMNWQQQHAMLITLTFYLSYLVLVLGRNHREYRATLDLELKLLEQQSQLDRLSRTDSLTQLGNRLQFNGLFPAMVASARRQDNPLSLVLLDIDFFKRINDEHGHSSGDACLSDFAERMRRVFRRDSDALLRLGGEEFGVLMPGTSLKEACDALEADPLFREVLGAEIVEEREFTDTGGARSTDSGHVQVQAQLPVLTQRAPDHDILITADEHGVFAGYMPYHTWDARLVAGSAGLVPRSWHPALEAWGAMQFQNRFERLANRPIREEDYQAWLALRIVGEAATRTQSADPATLRAFILSDQFDVAGFKGQALTFRDWNGQLRQPILLADAQAGVIGACHAGWRGALGGIIEATVDAMRALGATQIRAVIGPTISQRAYEVGPDFMDSFLAEDPGNDRFFSGGPNGRPMFDLPSFGLMRLRDAGVEAEWSGHCTYSDPDKFFSYRRATHEGQVDYGRLISAITL